jgi:fumarate reductase subunit D
MQQMVLIAKLIVRSTCFGHHYAHHQELKSIIQVVAACGIWCFGLQVVGLVWSCRLCVRFAGMLKHPANRTCIIILSS